jgi:uncharacterized HAD superfamily protein
MKQKAIIAIDIDDVIVETAAHTVDYYNSKYGTRLTLKDMYSDNLESWGVVDKATAIARVEAYLATAEFQNILPLTEAVSAIKHLAKRHELHVVTGRSTVIEAATNNSVDAYFPGIFRSVTFTNLFNEKKRSKADVCQKLGVSVLIEDHLGHALPAADAGIDVLLFGNYPWNQADNLPNNVHRVTDWAAVLQYFDEQG